MTRIPRPTAFIAALLILGGAAPPLAAAAGRLAYLQGGAAWVLPRPDAPPQRLPNSQGAALLAVSPVNGALAYLGGPPGVNVDGEAVPPLTPWISVAPYTRATRLPAAAPGLRARWLDWSGDGRELQAGTDAGLHGWRWPGPVAFSPTTLALTRSVSGDGEVTAELGSVASRDEPGVLLYGPGARPGTELFSRALPQALMSALRAQPALKTFTGALDPRAQRDAANWVLTRPQVTRDGRQVYVATNAGWGVGSGGTTTFAVLRLDVQDVRLSSLGWIGALSGSALELRPSPDGRWLLLLLTRQVSAGENTTLALVADLQARTVRMLEATRPPSGRTVVLAGACWLSDRRHLALSVARPRGQELRAQRDFQPPPSAFELLLLDARSGAAVRRIPGATQPACGPA